jgi:hypothetical protein
MIPGIQQEALSRFPAPAVHGKLELVGIGAWSISPPCVSEYARASRGRCGEVRSAGGLPNAVNTVHSCAWHGIALSLSQKTLVDQDLGPGLNQCVGLECWI